jgi:hypothetical protein
MLSQWIRVLYSDNGVLTDYSLEAQDGTGITLPVVAAEDYIYVGQYYPFNNIFFRSSVANTTTSTVSVQYWSSYQWIDAVDVLDGTKVAGKTLAQSGVVTFSPDDENGWTEVVDTEDVARSVPTELNTKVMYNLYWARVKFSANLLNTTKVSKIGYKFTRESVIAMLDPDINEYLTNWAAGKTNWEDQSIAASELVILDLKGKGLIRNPAQILRFDELYYAVAWKTLSLIYGGLGNKFNEKRAYAEDQYRAIVNTAKMLVDADNNAFVNKNELRTGMLVR